MKKPIRKIKVGFNIKKVIFKKIPVGVYSVIIFQDLDGDNKLNKFLGVPIEPYGVSKNILGVPSFKETSFEIKKNKNIYI